MKPANVRLTNVRRSDPLVHLVDGNIDRSSPNITWCLTLFYAPGYTRYDAYWVGRRTAEPATCLMCLAMEET